MAKLEGDLSSDDCAKWWDTSKINIFDDWERCDLDQVVAWQYSINKRFSAEDRIASGWLKEFMHASCTDALRNAVATKYEDIEERARGGVTYTYLILCEMFKMSREVKASMIAFIEFFKRRGIANYPGENVLVASNELLGVCKSLDVVDALTDEHVIDILTGLSIVNNLRFKKMFEQLLNCADLGTVNILPTVKQDDTPLEQIKGILDQATRTYDKLSKGNKWNVAKKGGGGSDHKAFAATGNNQEFKKNCCWNCGQEGCRPDKCNKPRDEARIKRCKEAWQKAKAARGANNSGTSGRGSSGSGNPSAPTATSGAKTERQRKVWGSANLGFVNGVLMAHCKKCGGYSNHSTSHHAKWAKLDTSGQNAYKMPDSHPLMKERALLVQGNDGGGCPQAPPDQPKPTANANTITFQRSELEAKINNVERTSTDPNAGSFAQMMRDLMLN